jgi:hypothetical protein
MGHAGKLFMQQSQAIICTCGFCMPAFKDLADCLLQTPRYLRDCSRILQKAFQSRCHWSALWAIVRGEASQLRCLLLQSMGAP